MLLLRLGTLLISVAIACVSGCASSMSATDLQAVQVGFEQALEMELAGNIDQAMAAIDKSIVQGGLDPDQLADGYLLRARCKARSGDLDGAEMDLENAERGAPDPGRWHWTRSILFEKQGKAYEAKSEMVAARKNDPLKRIP